MKPIQLLKLGFTGNAIKDSDGNDYIVFTLKKSRFVIEITDFKIIELSIEGSPFIKLWNCKNSIDLKKLINILSY